MIYTSVLSTPLGELLASVENGALSGLWFFDQKHFPKGTESWVESKELPIFLKIQTWLNSYFTGRYTEIDFELCPKGTTFQQLVWKHLLSIPFGETSTYGEMARKVATDMGRESMSAQAVGGAVGRNPISIIIPCHRVIGADRSLTGYDGGLDRKEALLKLEACPK